MELRKDFLQNTQEQDQLIMLKAFLFLTQTVGTSGYCVRISRIGLILEFLLLIAL